MRFFKFFALFLAFLLIGSLTASDAESQFVKSFRNPPSELYPIPWWSWKGDLEYSEMIRQLDSMKAQNINEFFIFASTYLSKPAFFSEEYFKYIQFTLDEAAKRGMKVWIYDDLNWPSGSCGGKLIKNYPEKREFELVYSSRKVNPKAFTQIKHKQLLLAKLEQDGEFKDFELDQFGFFTNHTDKPLTLHFIHHTAMKIRLLNAAGTIDSTYQRGQLDLLDPENFQLWIDTLYGEYEKRFGKYFGTLIKGFFTDEPQMHTFNGPTAPYNKYVRQEFIKRHKYDPEEHLFKLFLNIPGAEEFRRDYFGVTASIFSSNMAKLGKWCSDRNLLLTGHCIKEEITGSLHSFTLRNGDPHLLLKHFSAPGCDLLGHTVPFLPEKPRRHRKWAPEKYINVIYTAKFVSSTARWSKAPRAMCEAFGVRGFTCEMDSQKLINDFLAAMGINLINDNGIAYTIGESERGGKRFTSPWWNWYYLFNNASARLSTFASFGLPAAKTAVLVPRTTIWSRTNSGNWKVKEFAKQAAVFNSLSEKLLRNRIEFEYIFEDTPTADELKVFDYIMLPSTEFITPEMAARLEKFRKNGGKVIAVGYKPILTGKNIEWKSDMFFATPEEAVKVLPPAPYTLNGNNSQDVLSALRVKDGEYLLLIANQTEGRKSVTFKHQLSGHTQFMEVESGNVYNIPSENGSWLLTLEEGQSVIVRVANNAVKNALDRSKFVTLPGSKEKPVMKLDGKWAFDFGKFNIFTPVMQLRYDPMEEGITKRWYLNPPEEWFKIYGDEHPFQICQEECMYYWMRGTFDIKERVPENLSMIFSNDTADKVYVNGKECTAWSSYEAWDHMNRRCMISENAKVGKNDFYVRIKVSRWNDPRLLLSEYQSDMVLASVIAGDFAVSSDKSLIPAPAEISTGSWSKYGFAALIRPAVYRKNFYIEKVPANPILSISDAYSTVEVTLNGVKLPARAWKPFRFDLSGALKPGNNTIEIKVAGGFSNVLNRGSYSSAIQGGTVDYGLIGDVTIISGE